MATTRIIGGWGSLESAIFYDKTLIARALPKLVFDKYGRKAPIPANSGITIDFRKFETIADSETALTEGTPGAAVNPSVSHVVATIAQYGKRILAVVKALKFGERPLRKIPSQALKREGVTTIRGQLRRCFV